MRRQVLNASTLSSGLHNVPDSGGCPSHMLFRASLKLINFRNQEFSCAAPRNRPSHLFCGVSRHSEGSYAGGATRQANPGQQTAGSTGDEQSTLRFNADTTLVLIPVTVTDPLNRFVLGLQKQDFHLIEDGAEQTIAHFSGEDAPLSLGLVFDTSGSMPRSYFFREGQHLWVE